MHLAARRWLGVVLALCCAFVAAACSTRSPIAGIESRVGVAFDPALVAHGERLAAIGNCITCHTVSGQPAYSGGYPVRTPFGTVYGTNLTPDADTGLGRWSEDAFRRAMREGVGRDGRHLYPAFPYDHFALLTDPDLHALYAFLMTREPVRKTTPPNDVWVPRPLIGAWKALYLREGVGAATGPAPATPLLARGRYLVDGLAHCGACHTPRNALGAERRERAFDGADVDGWHAPALNARSTSPVPWTVEALAAYLRELIRQTLPRPGVAAAG
jgi:mono/diheme cytochrome c family protein